MKCIYCGANISDEKWENAKIILRPSSKLYNCSDEKGYAHSICGDCFIRLKNQFKEAEEESDGSN